MESIARVGVDEIIDGARVSLFQLRIIILCLLVSMLDGFDTQSIAFVAPSISQAWHLPPSQFGPIFSATLLGTAFGAVVFGRLADRYGRRVLVSVATAVFGSMTLTCAAAQGVQSLLVLRFLAGIGLGGAIPNFIAFASEYAPRRARARIVVATLWGFPAGAILGGLISTRLIPSLGWRSVFYLGGVLPLCLAPLLLMLLPESIRFLSQQPGASAAIAKVLQRIDPSHESNPGVHYYLPTTEGSPRRVGAVFAGRLAVGTVLLGTALCMSLLLAYLLVNWIPLLFRQMGLPLTDAVFGTVMLNLSGIAGSYVFSRRMDQGRHAIRVMIVGYAIAALAVASIGFYGSSRVSMMSSTACVGFFLIGTQLSLTAYIANYYPTAIRATGIGVTQAIGRCGSLVGPLLGGFLLSFGMLAQKLFQWGAIPALLAMSALIGLHFFERTAEVPLTVSRL
jgi:AAHS family 4-hydroxybenzoate transporter-like MFS transporter